MTHQLTWLAKVGAKQTLAQILARTRTVTKHRFLELVSDAVGDDAELLRRGLASARKQLQAQGWRPRSSPSS